MTTTSSRTLAVARALTALTVLACSDNGATTSVSTGTRFCPSGGAGSYATLNDAVANTPANGQIVVCDGTWDLDDQVISKPLTIRSEHSGGAAIRDADTLRVAQQGRPAIRVSGFTSGTVRFVDLTFRIGGRGVVPSGEVPGTTRDTTGTYDKVVFDSTHWISRSATSAIGVVVRASTVPTAKVTFTHSDAVDMYIGIWSLAQVETETTFSTFNHTTIAGPDYSGNNVSDGGSFGTIADNTLHLCGSQGCIRIVGGGQVLVARNTMDGIPGASSLGGIVLARPTSPGPTGVLTIQDNVVNGAAISGASGSGAWTFQAGISLQDGAPSQHVVTGNKLNNVYIGISALAEATASNNVITGATFGVSQSSLRTLLFNRNDVINAATSFQAPGGAGNYTCNWWGQASGPILPAGAAGASLYTPFATARIAGTTNACP